MGPIGGERGRIEEVSPRLEEWQGRAANCTLTRCETLSLNFARHNRRFLGERHTSPPPLICYNKCVIQFRRERLEGMGEHACSDCCSSCGRVVFTLKGYFTHIFLYNHLFFFQRTEVVCWIIFFICLQNIVHCYWDRQSIIENIKIWQTEDRPGVSSMGPRPLPRTLFYPMSRLYVENISTFNKMYAGLELLSQSSHPSIHPLSKLLHPLRVHSMKKNNNAFFT